MKALSFIVAFITVFQAAVSAGTGKLTVKVDERIELLTVVQLLADYRPKSLLTQSDIRYKKEVIRTFSGFKDHQVIKFFKSMSESWFAFSTPVSFILHHELPDLRRVSEFTKSDLEEFYYEKQKDSLDNFLRLMADFYRSTGFHEFFVSHRPYYDSIASSIIEETKRVDYIRIMEDHYGQKQRGYEIILSPLQGDCGYGPMIHTPEGDIYYAVVGPSHTSKDIPFFEKEVLFQELVIHEFSHSFCNPLIDEFFKEMEDDSCLLVPILSSQKSQGYGEWKTCLYEHLTRANEIVLSGIIYGDSAGEERYRNNAVNEKFIYLEGLVPLIRNKYLKDRKRYGTLKDLMPEIVLYFDSQKRSCP